MIAAWMVAATAFALLLGAAAIAAERALRMMGRAGRGAWIFALGAAIGWPVIAPAAAAAFAGLHGRAVHAATGAASSDIATIWLVPPAIKSAWGARVDTALLAIWVFVSLVLLLRLAIAMRALSRVERIADREVIEGVPVLVTPTLGPAVFGARRPRVLMPRWLFDLDAPLRALVIRHEQEHCRARDPQLVLAMALITALTPWNAGVWWIARRLRFAIEVDCDARVLRHASDSECYSRLLLFIAQRQSRVRLAPMLAESNSHLSRRIDAMYAQRPTNPRVRIAVLAVLAVCALAFSTKFAKELIAAPSIALGNPRVSPPGRAVAESTPVLTVDAPSVVPHVAASTQTGNASVVVRHDDRPAQAIPGTGAPRYPEILKAAGVEGGVLVAFVVNADGGVDTTTIKLVRSTHELFANAVRVALADMRFRPAVVNDQAVRQVVQMPVIFSLFGSPLATEEGRRASLERLLDGAESSGLMTLSAIQITGMPPVDTLATRQ